MLTKVFNITNVGISKKDNAAMAKAEPFNPAISSIKIEPAAISKPQHSA